MSKTKTKRARRELKREGDRKIAAHHKKIAKAAETAKPSPANSKSASKKQKKANAPDSKKPEAAPKPQIQASQRHDVPFGTYDHILLVGEGDFSFTRSLAVSHGCANITATSYDTASEVAAKYPDYASIRQELTGLTPPVPLHHSIDATKLNTYKHLRCDRSDDDDDDDGGSTRKGQGSAAGWDTIAFMFPHVGGLSTDVNRQVRANQALLVSFFAACLDANTPQRRLQILQSQGNSVTPRPSRNPFLRMGGKVVVALFEGEPYTLWNVRDLARHAGLRVVESWRFDWEQYPGYKHVRTLGTVESGWKGEDREARMYVFEKVPLVADSDEEKEMERMKKRERGGALPSQKAAMKRAREEEEE
ncbi:hypothetical protein ACN47E_005265 [Coniothyrium glycines]